MSEATFMIFFVPPSITVNYFAKLKYLKSVYECKKMHNVHFEYTGCFFNSDTFQMKKKGTKIIFNTIMNYKLKTTYIDVLFHSRVYFVNFKICSK